ncbi:MAG: tetratricopeptide repeat protein [Bacteroidota bacterium]
MNQHCILIVWAFCFCLPSFACINTYYTPYTLDKEGHWHTAGDLSRAFNKNFNHQLIERKLVKLQRKIRRDDDFRLLSDCGVLMLKGGKAKEALALFEDLHRAYPKEYPILANLATAYEVTGQLDHALFYIKKALHMNPEAHHGSEWIHKKILKEKIRLLRSDGDVLSPNFLQLTLSQKQDPATANQLLWQIRERFPFTPAQNEMMGYLLIELGDCLAYTSSIEYAKVMYVMAREYHGIPGEMVNSKIENLIELRESYKEKKPDPSYDSDHFHVKQEGVSYLSMLDDFQNPPYRLQWERISLRPDTLYQTFQESLAARRKLDSLKEAELRKLRLWGMWLAGGLFVGLGMVIWGRYKPGRHPN